MPIYEYQCKDCGHQMEALQRISDPVLTDCPACHNPSLVKKVSAAAFRLKGGGWYETDFKSSGNKKNLAGGANDNSAKTNASENAGNNSGASGSKSSSESSTSASKSGGESSKSQSSSVSGSN